MAIDFPPAIQFCVAEASERYKVPSELIYSIIEVEGGGPGVAAKNNNGTEDLGWAQINTVWLPELKKYGITKTHLLYNPCVNIGISAWILRSNYARYDNWNDAISAYNAGFNLKAGRQYARKVILKWHQLKSTYNEATYTLSMNQ